MCVCVGGAVPSFLLLVPVPNISSLCSAGPMTTTMDRFQTDRWPRFGAFLVFKYREQSIEVLTRDIGH